MLTKITIPTNNEFTQPLGLHSLKRAMTSACPLLLAIFMKLAESMT
jgi:hypothetical protein